MCKIRLAESLNIHYSFTKLFNLSLIEIYKPNNAHYEF